MTSTSRPTWNQIASAPIRPAQRSTFTTAIALLVAIGPIIYRASTQGLGRPLANGAAVLLLLLLPIPRRAFWVPPVIAIAALLVGEATRVPFGLLVAVVTVASLAAFGRERFATRDIAASPLPRAIVGAGVLIGHMVMLRSNRVTAIALFVAAALLVGFALSFIPARGHNRVFNGIESAAARIGAGVATVLVAVSVGPLIVIVWVVHQIFRFDPLHTATASGTAWVRRAVVVDDPDRAYAIVKSASHQTMLQRARSAGAATTIAAALVGLATLVGVIVVPRLDSTLLTGADPFQPPPPAAPERIAARNEPWFDDLSADLSKTRTDWDAMAGFVLDDLESEYVNIENGARRSWVPPDCDCERLTVWVFGGSSAFGYWQRDEHTIASELSRVAYESEVYLDVVNYSQPAYSLWQEVGRFATVLGAAEDGPDLVVFFDGANEFGVQVVRNENGYGADSSPASALDEPMLTLFPRAMGLLTWASKPDDSPQGPDPKLSDEEVATVASKRYLESKRAATALSEGIGAEHVFAWQPIFTGAPIVGDIDFTGKENVESWTAMQTTMSSLLPDDVLDYSALLDDAGEPVFYDLMHINERGARLVAEQLFEDITPQLDRLVKRTR